MVAEPGRFLSAELEQQVVRIIGTEETKNEKGVPEFAYYLSNGVYQSFLSCIYFKNNIDEIEAEGICLKPLRGSATSMRYSSTLWGPTCDGGDKLMEGIMLPQLYNGDYLCSFHTGAYNNAMNTNFNGICNSKPFYYYSQK